MLNVAICTVYELANTGSDHWDFSVGSVARSTDVITVDVVTVGVSVSVRAANEHKGTIHDRAVPGPSVLRRGVLRSSMRIPGEAAKQLAGSPSSTSQQRCSTAGLVPGSIGVVDGVMYSSKTKKSTESGTAGGE